MPIAILIGFEYTFNSLTGAIIDLYHAFSWCRSFGCYTHILTDISVIKDPDNLQQVVDRKIADSDILTFYNKIPFNYDAKIDAKSGPSTNNKEPPNLEQISQVFKTIVRNSVSLQNSILKILSAGIPDNKVIIYYSGHGVKDSMVMPDRTLLPFIDFRDNILSTLNPCVELFWILDCCNPNGIHLPFKLEKNSFVLSSSKIECVLQPILLITSSEAQEKSIATKSGSVFSRHLFRMLAQMNVESNTLSKPTNGGKKFSIPVNKNRNLKRIIGYLASSIRKMHTGYAQTVSVYSSYVIDPVLWMWIGSRKSYDIITDITLSVIIVRQTESCSILQRDQAARHPIGQNSYNTFTNNKENSRNHPLRSSQKPTKTKSNINRDKDSGDHEVISIPSLYNIAPIKVDRLISSSSNTVTFNSIDTSKHFINPYDLIYPN